MRIYVIALLLLTACASEGLPESFTIVLSSEVKGETGFVSSETLEFSQGEFVSGSREYRAWSPVKGESTCSATFDGAWSVPCNALLGDYPYSHEGVEQAIAEGYLKKWFCGDFEVCYTLK